MQLWRSAAGPSLRQRVGVSAWGVGLNQGQSGLDIGAARCTVAPTVFPKCKDHPVGALSPAQAAEPRCPAVGWRAGAFHGGKAGIQQVGGALVTTYQSFRSTSSEGLSPVPARLDLKWRDSQPAVGDPRLRRLCNGGHKETAPCDERYRVTEVHLSLTSTPADPQQPAPPLTSSIPVACAEPTGAAEQSSPLQAELKELAQAYKAKRCAV